MPPVGGSSPSWAGRRIGIGAALGRVSLALAVAFGGLAAGAGYWQVIESANLSSSGDDAAVIAAARNVRRGEIFDRDGERIAWNRRDGNGEPYRVYASNSLSHVLGYSSRQYGTAGLERAWNAQLSGVVSADPLRELTRKFRADPSDPQALRTTLVLELQEAARAALGGNRGAVVLIDPRNGEVLALVSTPTYDASAVADPTTATRTFERLSADDRQPLLPRATQGLYVPGSVFKIVTAVAALGSGAVSPDTTYDDQPSSENRGWLIDGFRVRDGHHLMTGDTALDFARAVEASCNIWFAETGVRTGGDVLGTGRAGWASAVRSASISRRPPPRSRTATASSPAASGPCRAGERGLRPGPDARHATADGAGGRHGRQRRRADGAAPRPRGDGQGRHDDGQRRGDRPGRSDPASPPRSARRCSSP